MVPVAGSASFTPGPWIAVDNRDGFGGEIIITTQERIDNSRVAICEIDEDFTEPFGREQRSNKHLIIAAPVMLDALKRLEVGLANEEEHGMWEADYMLDQIIRPALREAIGQNR
jgi:hypothetical protein